MTAVNDARQRLTLTLIGVVLAGCIGLPGGTVVDSATVVYTAGSSQHTVAVELPLLSSDVFAALVRIVEEAGVETVNRNDKAYLLEVITNGKRLTGQVTNLGVGKSLLYVWADAGVSGQTGRELAIEAVELVCDDLGVAYELVNY